MMSSKFFIGILLVALLVEESGCDALILEDSPVKILMFNF